MERAPLPVVIVAEDEVLVRMMLVEALENEGFEVLEADDAAQAMALFDQQGSVDLLITDVRMPGDMDGVALAQWVRSHRPATKIIVMSGYMPGSEIAAAARGFDDFFAKPYNPHSLVARARELVMG